MNFFRSGVTKTTRAHVFVMPWTVVAAFLAIVLPAAGHAQPGVVPQGWFKAGNSPDDYEVGTDDSVRRTGAASAYVKARVAAPRGFGTLMQAFAADEYRGKRIRLSGYLRAVNVREAGLWLRIDAAERQANRLPLAFDNTQSRVKPAAEWTPADIVVDVPAGAGVINFGLLLAGEGQVWVDDLALTVVGADVPLTGGGRPQLPSGPRNLDFERKPPRPPTSDER